MPVTEKVVFTKKETETICNILQSGLDYAAVRFSEMLNRKITIAKPTIEVLPLQELPSVVQEQEDYITCVYLRFQEGFVVESIEATSGFSGNIMLMFDIDKAFEIVGILLSELGISSKDTKKLFDSALGEVGNVTGTAVLNTISDRLKIPVNPSPPMVMTDMAGALLSSLGANISMETNEVILIDTYFISHSREIKSRLLIVPDNSKVIYRLLENE